MNASLLTVNKPTHAPHQVYVSRTHGKPPSALWLKQQPLSVPMGCHLPRQSRCSVTTQLGNLPHSHCLNAIPFKKKKKIEKKNASQQTTDAPGTSQEPPVPGEQPEKVEEQEVGRISRSMQLLARAEQKHAHISSR